MNILVGDEVNIVIESLHGTSTVTGPVISIGLANHKEGVYCFQIAGITATFWSDEIKEVNKIG